MTMDESAIKGLKSLDLNASGAESRKTRLTKISVEGYGTYSLHDACALKLELTKHFSYCGRVGHIYIPKDFEKGILKSVSFMSIDGEDVVDKALQLSGTDVGGWTPIVKAAPWQKEHADPWCPAVAKSKREEVQWVYVNGFDTSLPTIDVRIAMCQHFSSCGEVTDVTVSIRGVATVYLKGKGCVDKALKLSGCNMGAMTLVVKPVVLRPVILKNGRVRPITRSTPYGYTPPRILLEVAKEKKKKIETEMDMDMDMDAKKKMKMELMKVEKDIKTHTETQMKMDMYRKKKMEMENLEKAPF